MAVTLTVAELSAALRLNDSAEETAEVRRLLEYCTEAVTQHAPDASDTAMNEAVRRLAGYLFGNYIRILAKPLTIWLVCV